jgi:autophagy-related protein 2
LVRILQKTATLERQFKTKYMNLQKLAAILHLPPAVTLDRAVIHLLRLTIPADLHISGIVVEIAGVELSLKLHNGLPPQSSKVTQPRPAQGPARGAKSNRPRIATPSVHDPGGASGLPDYEGDRHDTGAIPSSLDLAQSFLQSEPQEEQIELQEAIASQSQYMQSSVTSTKDSEVGIGAPGGWSLPSFIADFFKGIGDRLEVSIKDVTLTVETTLSQDSPGKDDSPTDTDSFKIMVKLSELSLHGLNLQSEEPTSRQGKRQLVMHDFKLFLLSDPEAFSQYSQSPVPSSPRLTRSKSKPSSDVSTAFGESSAAPGLIIGTPSSAFSSEHGSIQIDSEYYSSPMAQQSQGQQDFMDEFVENEDMSDSSIFGGHSRSASYEEQLSASSSDSVPAFASISNSEVRPSDFMTSPSRPPRSTLDSSNRLQRALGRQRGLSNSDVDIDNQERAEMLARTGQLDASGHSYTEEANAEDLAESKIFSHEDAESMYMSAVSNNTSATHPSNAMPGGWGWSENSPPEVKLSLPQDPEHSQTIAEGLAREDTHPEVTERISPIAFVSEDVQPSSHQAPTGDKSIDSDDISLVAKQLLTINQVSVWLSFHHDDLNPSTLPSTTTFSDLNITKSSQDSVPYLDGLQRAQLSKTVHGSSAHEARTLGRRLEKTAAAEVHQTGHSDFEVDVSDICAQLDISVVRLLIIVAKEALNTLDSTKSQKPVEEAQSSSPTPAISLKVKNVKLQICEQVPEETFSQSALAAAKLSCPDIANEDALLSLRLSGIGFSTSSNDSQTNQRFSISRISLSHSTGELISFLHNIKMQSSVKDIDSLNQDALLARINSAADVQNVDIQMKPIYVKLDLLKLDDVLSKSGGLSSLLDLGNSIVSTSTVRSSSRKIEPPKPRPRSVRFHVSPQEIQAADHVDALSGKINARIAGAFVDVVGSTCSVKLQCSAIKTVYRQEGLGVVIDRAKLEGPLLPNQTETADINIRFKNIRLEYLPTPNEKDLDRLLNLLTPSNNKYDEDDDIMVDTLLRQRRQGGVLRLNVDEIESSFEGLAYTSNLLKLVSELGKLSTVAKYLPEDDRPGILTFALAKKLDCRLTPDSSMGELRLMAEFLEGAHVNVPSLMAAQILSLSVSRAGKERLIGEVLPSNHSPNTPPMVMCRFIADEMDPTIKLKLYNTCFEYSVPTVVAMLDFSARLNPASTSTTDPPEQSPTLPEFNASPSSSKSTASLAGRSKIAVGFRDSALGLRPLGMSSKALIILTDASLLTSVENKKDNTFSVNVKKASIMITNDVERLNAATGNADHNLYFDENDQIQLLTQQGYVLASYISSASATIKTSEVQNSSEQTLDVELRNNLLVLETCADSTQTLISILSNLSPPSPPDKTSKYRTETIVPIEDMLASFTGDAFVAEPGPEAGLRAGLGIGSDDEVVSQQDLEYVSDFFPPDTEGNTEDLAESYAGSGLAESMASTSASIAPVTMNESTMAASQENALAHSLLEFREDYFVPESNVGGTAHRWNSSQNTYGLPNDRNIRSSPLRVRVRDVHIIWNLFDGYDWQSTRDKISEAVSDIEARASARQPRSKSRLSTGAEDEEEESVIGDFLFNSIYIGIPANKDPRELANAINHDIDELASETGSYATTTTVTGSPARNQQGARVRRKKLRLSRSKTHKMTFELDGISADFLVFPPGTGEIESSLDVRVKNLTIFDHLPTSTWRKFATYMQDAGVRETDTNMVHLEILNVKPVAELAASEMIVKVTVLPLRLHVDQDALDFMSRFFEFKDDSVPISSTPSAPPFLQRVEVNPIKVKLDFKPKRVDYGGLRSGRTTEFMNFFVLDRADMVLRRVILYGVSGFDRLGIMLNNIWMPDVKRNQLPGILAGLAPIRSLVDVGGGVKDLVVIPMREYKKDGRIVRSIQKGALAFAKTTTKELVNLGAKLAIGTQTVLQDAEAMLGPSSGREQWEEEGIEEDTKKQISLYADQPMGVVQGLRGAYASLERDLLLARDAIIAVPGEVMASGSASGAARAVLRQTPTIILRPAIGATKAVGQTLLGAGNTLDRDNWRRVEEVSHSWYISYCVTLRSICRSTRGIRYERHGTRSYLVCYRRLKLECDFPRGIELGSLAFRGWQCDDVGHHILGVYIFWVYLTRLVAYQSLRCKANANISLTHSHSIF